jgi:hypothetical protein
MGLDKAWKNASIAFEKAFSKSPKKEKVTFIINDSIL